MSRGIVGCSTISKNFSKNYHTDNLKPNSDGDAPLIDSQIGFNIYQGNEKSTIHIRAAAEKTPGRPTYEFNVYLDGVKKTIARR